MAYINPLLDGFVNYSRIKDETLLNETILPKTDKEGYFKWEQDKKRFKNKDIEFFKKICLGIIHYNDNVNEFEFPEPTDPDGLFARFEQFIVRREVSKFLFNSNFLEKFYKTYAKIYYSKMASTVRNYTVEAISLKSAIFPFEAAFTDFINQYSEFDDVINDITSNVLYICTKKFIRFHHYCYNVNKRKRCNISFYDLFFRPNYASKKLCKVISINNKFKFDKVPSSIIVDDINYNALKYYIKHDAFDEINLKDCNIKASSLVYTVIKRSIRYAFVIQMKRLFGLYLVNNKEKYPEIKSIISDTNLYHTQDLINVKQNIKYLKNVITFCDSILSIKRKRKAIMNKTDNVKDFTQYIKSIVEHMRSYNNVAMNIMGDLKNLYMMCFDKNQSQSVVYNTEMYKTLKTISEYFCIRNETKLTKMQRYNFSDKWYITVGEDIIIDPINYVEFRIIKEF